MNRLSRYLFLEVLTPSLTVLGIITLLILMPQALKLVDLWVNKEVPISFLGNMILFIIPKFLVSGLPIALMLGILLGLGRLSQDSEIVVMKATGVSLQQMARPILLLVACFTALSYMLSLFWAPESRHNFALLKTSLLSTTALSMPPRTFTTHLPGLMLYVNERTKGQQLKGVFIHDKRIPDKPIIMVAETALLSHNAQGDAILALNQGSRHFKDSRGDYQRLTFNAYDLDLGVAFGPKAVTDSRTVKAHTWKVLNEMIDNPRVPGQSLEPWRTWRYQAVVEWHRRLSFPVATMILGILAIPLGVQSHRAGRSYGVITSVVILIVYFVLLSTGESLAKKEIIPPLVGFWTPALAMAFVTASVVRATHRERPLKAILWLTGFLSRLPRRILLSGKNNA